MWDPTRHEFDGLHARAAEIDARLRELAAPGREETYVSQDERAALEAERRDVVARLELIHRTTGWPIEL